MKIIYLWGTKDIPTPETWSDFNVLKAFYCEDDNIPAFNEVVQHPYYNVPMRKKMYFVLTEASFFTLSYIDKVENGVYTLKSMVKTKKPENRDYDIEIYTDADAYQTKLDSYGSNVVICDDVIRNKHVTTDPNVEMIYYPKVALKLMENY